MLNSVRIAQRFRRSIRIDTDLDDEQALDGFVCPKSSANVLLAMAQHISHSGQSAFTWTGPYGSGKSSLIVAFASLLHSSRVIRKSASKTVGVNVANEVHKALPVGKCGWRIVPVVGSRSEPVSAIGEAMKLAGLVSRRQRLGWTENYVVEKLADVASKKTNGSNGVLLFIDEMGKFLESSVQENSDIYIFQQLAEAASRSEGRFVIVGVLHQAFAEYAHRLPRESRNEWAKIQGRFVDLAVNTTGNEQIELISRAIRSDYQPKAISRTSYTVAKFSRSNQHPDISVLAHRLERCWPLHPVVAYLLGPISRRRFGQNQRSIFGFLNSAELHGFQHFLQNVDDDVLYSPSRLWDYLRVNLEPSILASPDGHRWAMATEGLERCESIGGDDLHVRLLKTIAIIDLFKERSGLFPNISLLKSCFPDVSNSALTDCLTRLSDSSLIVYKKYLNAYAIFAGSDFDIEEAVRVQLEGKSDIVDFSLLVELSGLQPILAKRHYHTTGTLRWFEVSLAPLHEIVGLANDPQLKHDVVGQFILAIAVSGEQEEYAHKVCREAARISDGNDFVAGYSSQSNSIMLFARELVALEKIRNNHPELSGDSVARKEVEARIVELQELLESELRKSFDTSKWYRKYHSAKTYSQSELNQVASDLADARFKCCPKIHNELLNRQKPSGSAVAAQKALLRRMVQNEGEPRLGICGYPAEGGLYDSLIEKTSLYIKDSGEYRFVPPIKNDPCNLFPMWEAAAKVLQINRDRTVAISEIYEVWRNEPFGIKNGLMVVYAMAFILSQRNHIAIYRDGVFRTKFDDVDIDYLVRNASTIQLRWVNLSALSQRLLSVMIDILDSLGDQTAVMTSEPIDVARGLVRVYEQLPPWTKRTMYLSKIAIQVRELFKQAHDPNQFLFYDIPSVVGNDEEYDITSEESILAIAKKIGKGLVELVNAYDVMLQRLNSIVFSELHLSESSPDALENIRERAGNIRGISGDFRIEAFIGRLSQFDGTNKALEGIVSLAINKPSSSWVDLDIDRAKLELADMSQRFLLAETFARVKGRTEKRHAMAVIVGRADWIEPKISNFQIGDEDREIVDLMVSRLSDVLNNEGENRQNVILAALAELSSNYMPKSIN